MPARGAVPSGRVVTSATTGSVVNLVPRDCTVLGFWATATTTINVYDTTGTVAANQQIPIAACVIGWNPLPIDMVNGLSINQAAQVWFVVI